jgi:hypothetical protein
MLKDGPENGFSLFLTPEGTNISFFHRGIINKSTFD